jgi:hypothetical protein
MEPKVQHHRYAMSAFELCFQPLSGVGRALRFACDAAGKVDLDSLGERARCNYFYARTVIGREFARPAVQPGALQ